MLKLEMRSWSHTVKSFLFHNLPKRKLSLSFETLIRNINVLWADHI